MIQKIRAYSKEYGMSEPFTLLWDEIVFNSPKDGGMSATIYRSDPDWATQIKRFKFMQSLGLKDKNGKEFFDRDIIEWIPVKNHPLRYTVYYDNKYFGMWMANPISDKPRQAESGRIWKLSKVIGNIHENPELLKEQP